MIDLSSAPKHVAFTNQLSLWLRAAGVADADARATLAVGLADLLAASKQIESELEAALARDPSVPHEADAALAHLCNINAWLFTDLAGHVEDMAPLWEPQLEEKLALQGTPGDDESLAAT